VSLRREGKTVLLITHKLREIREVTDVRHRDAPGASRRTLATTETTPEQLAEQMVGRR